jgi:hypothetical protein
LHQRYDDCLDNQRTEERQASANDESGHLAMRRSSGQHTGTVRAASPGSLVDAFGAVPLADALVLGGLAAPRHVADVERQRAMEHLQIHPAQAHGGDDRFEAALGAARHVVHEAIDARPHGQIIALPAVSVP